MTPRMEGWQVAQAQGHWGPGGTRKDVLARRQNHQIRTSLVGQQAEKRGDSRQIETETETPLHDTSESNQKLPRRWRKSGLSARRDKATSRAEMGGQAGDDY